MNPRALCLACAEQLWGDHWPLHVEGWGPGQGECARCKTVTSKRLRELEVPVQPSEVSLPGTVQLLCARIVQLLLAGGPDANSNHYRAGLARGIILQLQEVERELLRPYGGLPGEGLPP